MTYHQGPSATLKRGTMKLAAALLIGTAMSAVVAVPAHAQVNNASLRGTITTAQGNAPTQVVAVEVNTGYRRNATIGADGSYNFPSLRAGTYMLEITTPSGKRSTDQFTLTVGQSASFDFDLSTPSAATQPDAADSGAATTDGSGDIIVTGGRIRSLEGGEVGVNITRRLIEQLPQNNRNFLAFADLAPGVAFVTGSNGQSRLQGGAQDSRTVNIFIDGVGQKDYVLKNGITGQDSTQGNPFPQLAIGEYRVISSNYKAEFDQVSSVAITAETKSGTNQFHGEGFFDFTNQSLRERRPSELNSTKVKTQDKQFGGALGGPIIKDVMHFFVTYEGKRQQVPGETIPGLSRPVSFFPTQYQGNFGVNSTRFSEDLYFGKIDIVPTDSDLLEFSVKYRDETGEFPINGIFAPSTQSFLDNQEIRGVGRWQHTGEKWVNDFKVAYEDTKYAPTPSSFADGQLFAYAGPNAAGTPGVVERGDLLRIGGSGNFQDKGQKGYQISDDFTYTGLERHTFKVGVKTKFVTLNTTEQNNINPLYTYNAAYNPNGGTFNDQIPYRVQFSAPINGGDPNIRSKNFQLGLYAQDDWDVTDRLTLNLGIRWDYERTPAFLNYVTPAAQVAAVSPANYPNLTRADYNINDFISTGSERKAFKGAFQPRIGFSYKLDEDGRYTVFGGYGRSYDRNQFDFLQQELAQGVYATRTFNFNTGDTLNSCTPSTTCVTFNPIYLTAAGRSQLLAAAGVQGGRELRFINNDLKVPYSDQFSLGARGRLLPSFEAEVGYSHILSRDGFAYLLGNRRADGSFFAPGVPADSPFGTPPPGFGAILLGTNGLKTNADSGYLKLTKDYTRESPWSLNATYTFTLAEENRQFGEYFSLDFPSLDDYTTTRSSGVSKHRFVAAGSVDTPIGVTLSSRVTMASPPFIKGIIGFGSATVTPGRTVVATETEGNGDRWGLRQIDFAATKYIKLGFITEDTQIRIRADVINAFNDRNYVDYNGDPSSPNFGKRNLNSLNVGGNPPRTIKLSAGFSF